MTAGAPQKDPQLKKMPACFRLPCWILSWLRDQDESQSVLIEEALIKKHKLKPPSSKGEK